MASMKREDLTTKLITEFSVRDIRENFYSFNCDNSSLSSYLYRSSYFDSLDFVNSTSVLVNEAGIVRGYFTLKQDRLKVQDLEYGALRIERFAVCETIQLNGLGRRMMKEIETYARATSLRFLILETLYESRNFYYKTGFSKLFDKPLSADVAHRESIFILYKDLEYSEKIDEAYPGND
ncbi:GNAT family N-acetyltransferase [Listeria newyorkensis]|uniref:GNAT family N-acetyltransferase n=2 Tax=Listeria newyorkensis TaxID=1497681 RepID=A0A841YTU7_9LIST|nr:GNAT family N-acetyltransferase [Listeria newyorkensis]